MKLKQNFEDIKYEKANITIDDNINTVFEMLFRVDTENLEISESIKNILLEELINENKKKMEENNNKDKYKKYFFEKSESLKKFVCIYIIINKFIFMCSKPTRYR